VDYLAYKEEGNVSFKAASRQVLFADPALGCEMRYFEVAAGGYSSLERHEHAHAVLILRGHGHGLVGDEVRPVETYDLITIPSWTWHQMRATKGQPLGFLCMVNTVRDRPKLPSAEDLATLRSNPAIAAFLDGTPLEG
jgi:quercetin dioxygenase-like cupin family protein